MADRFYSPEPAVEGRATLVGDEAKHLSRVRRIKPGELVELFDGRGNAYRAEVREIGRDRVELDVSSELIPEPRPSCSLTLAMAVPKGDRFDWLVEKATELGVARLVPLLTSRSVVAPRQAKLERLRRVIVEAAKQCGWNRLMTLEQPASWEHFLRTDPDSIRLLAHPGAAPGARWPSPGRDGAVVLAIGPEGGFTELEVSDACAAGWQMIGLGHSLLRIETAALAASAVILVRAAVG